MTRITDSTLMSLEGSFASLFRLDVYLNKHNSSECYVTTNTHGIQETYSHFASMGDLVIERKYLSTSQPVPRGTSMEDTAFFGQTLLA